LPDKHTLPLDLIARERTIFQRELLNRAVRVRMRLVIVCLTMGVIDLVFDVIPGDWKLLVGGSLLMLLANEVVARINRRERAGEAHLLAMQLVDTLMMGVLVVTFGEQGYLGIPFVIYAATGYAMGHARAAQLQYAMGCLVYPLARVIGRMVVEPGDSEVLWTIALETLCLATIGWMSMQAPVRYVHRVRRARRALASLERGDFSVRLPTRALDDVGFLGVSFNVTAQALGTAMQSLEDEVRERARAEEVGRLAQQEATRMAARMAAVAEAADGIIAAESARTLRDVLAESCEQVLVAAEFSLALVEGSGASLRVLGDSPDHDRTVVAPEGEVGSVFEQRHTMVSSSPCILVRPSDAPTVRSAMRSPVFVGQDVVAIMTVWSNEVDAFGAADIAIFEALAALAATALRNILLVDELRSSREALSHQAHHDGLTGLANRRRFRERVVQLLAGSSPEQVAVLALGLDGFKEVNDSLGHAAGDRVLQQVAERLLNATRGCDLVARLGGDEFAIVLEHVPDEAHAVVVADRVLRATSSPFSVGARLVNIGTSIGISFGQPRDVHESRGRGTERTRDAVDVLLHEADVALYRAKTSGKSCWVLFESSMQEEERERRRLEHELRESFTNDSLQLEYQPIHDLESGRLRGVEALPRWNHPERGVLATAIWMPMAEESGVIVDVGRWVLARACTDTASWQRWQARHDPDAPPLTVAVGVSVRQLHQEGFVSEVREVLSQSGLAPGTLMLEVSEEGLLRAPTAAREQLERLHEAGVRIAIHDFGTGATSLGYLQGLPVDVLKIDRSFVQGVARGGSQSTLARTILALGEALSLETVAEGVDHEQQRVRLQALGCTLGQGTHFTRSMSADGVRSLLEAAPELSSL